MELDYVARAVRRYWPLVLISLVLGVALGQLAQPNAAPTYQSTALLLVVPSGDTSGGSVAGDRYISSQLVVLESPPMAAEAKALADVELSDAEVAGAVSFVQIPGTDVLRIVATTSSPTDSQAIANAYLDAYVAQHRSAVSDAETDATSLEQPIVQIEQRLAEIDEAISQALTDFVASGILPEGDVAVAEEVAPVLTAERDVLLEQYRELLRQRAVAQFTSQSDLGDEVIQRADLPTFPVAVSSGLYAIAIPVVMVLLGIAAATGLARSSPRVLDRVEVTEVLGTPFAAVMRERGLGTEPLGLVEHMTDGRRQLVHELCVQAAAQGAAGQSLTVLVAGTGQNAGTTALAVAISARFGQMGMAVALLDLDVNDPELTKYFGVDHDGFAALSSLQPACAARHDEQALPSEAFSRIPLENVALVGVQNRDGVARPLRGDPVTALETASSYVDVVVCDVGPVLTSAILTATASHADAIVLAVPIRTQNRSSLKMVARRLVPADSKLLPVAMPRWKTSRRPPARAEREASSDHV